MAEILQVRMVVFVPSFTWDDTAWTATNSSATSCMEGPLDGDITGYPWHLRNESCRIVSSRVLFGCDSRYELACVHIVYLS